MIDLFLSDIRFRKAALYLCVALSVISAAIFAYQIYAFITKGATPPASAQQHPPPDEFFRGVSRDSPVFLIYSFLSMAVSGMAAAAIHYGGQEQAGVSTGSRRSWQASLLPAERKMVLILEENNGSLTQSELVKISGMGKLRVSRLLMKLERIKVVQKHPYGMTNRITLVGLN